MISQKAEKKVWMYRKKRVVKGQPSARGAAACVKDESGENKARGESPLWAGYHLSL